ncbi:MAG: hypothetical protein GWN14_24355, partial [candidate division Zixibacteria bacterium]|nr:hypothetical protein [Gammaproteobacteria bacterium]NIX58964.1 hypothetical protein [candidate division Zixibacteria bacterium]
GNDGGVFRSTDGGETFESCNGGYQTSQFYGGFSSAETDSQLSMGGFQDNSTAVYDGQPIWRVHLGGGDGGWTAIHPTDPQIMYASAQFLQLAKSTNGLQSFVILSVPNVSGGPTVFIAPYVLAKDNPNILYAGRELIYKSTDGGFNWSTRGINTFLDGNPFLAMAISPQNSDVVYAATAPLAADPGVFRTTDGGVSWDSINGNLPNRFPGDLHVDPNNEATVYITMMGFGSSHVFKSNDYGSTWQDIDNGG